MSVILRTKRSSTSGSTPSNLELGELAVNIIDKKIWIGTGSEPPVLLSEPLTVEQLIAGDGISINTNNEINLDLSVNLPLATTIDKHDRVPFLDRTSTGVNLGTKLISYQTFLNNGLSSALTTEVFDPLEGNNQKVTIAIQDNNPTAFSIETLQNAGGGKLNLITVDTQVVGGANIAINGSSLNIEPSDSLIIGLAPITINAYSLTLTNANILDFSSDDATISGVSRIESGVDNAVYIQGNLIVSGYIETDTGIKGNTNDDSEYLGIGMEIDGGTW